MFKRTKPPTCYRRRASYSCAWVLVLLTVDQQLGEVWGLGPPAHRAAAGSRLERDGLLGLAATANKADDAAPRACRSEPIEPVGTHPPTPMVTMDRSGRFAFDLDQSAATRHHHRAVVADQEATSLLVLP